MFNSRPSNFLRRVLVADAISSAGLGLLAIAVAPTMSRVLDLPVGLLRETGVVLLPFAAFVAWIASRNVVPRGAVWVVIALNVLWVIDSIVLLIGGWVSPNALGQTFVIAQAAAVAILAALEYAGLQRAFVTG